MEIIFNTAGPNRLEMEYTIDPLSRFDLDEIMMYIHQGKYFVLHAPRQTGKTSCMQALRDYLNTFGDNLAVYTNVEAGRVSRNDVQSVVKSTVCLFRCHLEDLTSRHHLYSQVLTRW